MYFITFCISLFAIDSFITFTASSAQFNASTSSERSKRNYYDYSITLSLDHPREYISSPGFPYEYYPSNTQVLYEIKVKLDDEVTQMSTRILLTFEMFALEESQLCAKDGLEIEDSSKQVRVYCGLQVGRTILSEGNTLAIRFFTDASISSRGYSILIEMFNSGCSASYNEMPTGTFSSPNFPKKYYGSDLCVWKIEAPNGKKIRIKFNEVFEIKAYEPLCVQDYLSISLTGNFETDVKRYCHSKSPGVIISEVNVMLLSFRSDCCFEGKGFEISFEIIDSTDVTTTALPPPVSTPCPCGQDNSEVERIVGGEVVSPQNKYPWMVAIVDRKNAVFCGGVLINKQYVLTASHCLEKETESTIKVALGIHGVGDIQSVAVAKLVLHPEFHNRTYINDIGLIKLENPIDFTENVKQICLPQYEEFPVDSDNAVVAGWGSTTFGGRGSKELREVELEMVSNAKCISKFGGLILDTNLCAGGEEGKDACQGDSGSPLFAIKDSAWYVIGISSWGMRCALKGNPGVYTRVSRYLEWIEDNVSDAPPCTDVTPPIQPNLEDCGIPNSKESARIVGGEEADPFEFPWMATIVYNKTVIGAGALISNEYVLTAASLFATWMRWYPEEIDIFLGQHDLNKKELFTQRLQIKYILNHPYYGKPTPYNNDFALLKVDVPDAKLSPKYRKICLPRSSASYSEGMVMTTAGWGRTSTHGAGSTVLMKVDLDIISTEKCKYVYPGWVTDRTVCAMNEGKDTCDGDNGAPLMQHVNGRYYLVGVSSWASSGGCAVPEKPRAFSAVHRVLKWLSAKTGLDVA